MTEKGTIEKYGDVILDFVVYYNDYFIYIGDAQDGSVIEVGISIKRNKSIHALTAHKKLKELPIDYLVITRGEDLIFEKIEK